MNIYIIVNSANKNSYVIIISINTEKQNFQSKKYYHSSKYTNNNNNAKSNKHNQVIYDVVVGDDKDLSSSPPSTHNASLSIDRHNVGIT
jgi:hypothetical protein